MLDKEQSYNIEEFEPDSIKKAELIKFLNKLFHNYKSQYWEWEYSNSRVLIATYENKIIGHYASLSFPFYLNGEKIEGAKAEGSLVDINIIRKFPRGSDRKVFINLVKTYLKKTHFSFTFGFPTKEATPGQIKAGYYLKEIFIEPYILLCSTQQVIEKFIPLKVLSKTISAILDIPLRILLRKKVFASIVTAKEAKGLDLKNYVKKLSLTYQNTLITDKSLEFFNWKYYQNPFNTSEVFILKGSHNEVLAVLSCSFSESKGLRLGCISEASFLPNTSRSDLLDLFYTARNWMLSHNVNAVEFWKTDNQFSTSVYELAKEAGFNLKKKPFVRNILLHTKDNISLESLVIPATHCFKRF